MAVLSSPELYSEEWSCIRLIYQIAASPETSADPTRLNLYVRQEGESFDRLLWSAKEPSDSWLIASLDLMNSTKKYKVSLILGDTTGFLVHMLVCLGCFPAGRLWALSLAFTPRADPRTSEQSWRDSGKYKVRLTGKRGWLSPAARMPHLVAALQSFWHPVTDTGPPRPWDCSCLHTPLLSVCFWDESGVEMGVFYPNPVTTCLSQYDSA